MRAGGDVKQPLADRQTPAPENDAARQSLLLNR
ncbi:hypothetical protein F783_018055 [Bordetella holmesii F627]|nr:hypothetical protein F783_018055 [Bordetella holmesii F627]